MAIEYSMAMQICGVSALTLLFLSEPIREALAWTKHNYDNAKAYLKQRFEEIDDEIELTSSEQDLLNLLREAKDLVHQTSSIFWKIRFKDKASYLTNLAESELQATSERLRVRAKILKLSIDCDA